jgi:hypothetical protein
MNLSLEQLEQRVTREMELLRPLRTPSPSRATLDRVIAAVQREAEARRRQAPLRVWMTWSLGVAAALFLLALLSPGAWNFGPGSHRAAHEDAFASFDAWAEAFEATGTTIDFGFAAAGGISDAERDLDDWLEGLSASMKVGG